MKHNLTEMNALDIYLSNLSEDDYNEVRDQIDRSKSNAMPLISWDIFQENYGKRVMQKKKVIEVKQVLVYAKKFHWKNNLSKVLLENDYEALIITDASQKIIWVNNGFTTMTGYSKKYAVNKTPRFLQGEKTSQLTKQRISKKLTLNEPFKEVIVNHRKDASTYKCEVQIFPLYNDKTTHYIALEKQVV